MSEVLTKMVVRSQRRWCTLVFDSWSHFRHIQYPTFIGSLIRLEDEDSKEIHGMAVNLIKECSFGQSIFKCMGWDAFKLLPLFIVCKS